VQFPENIIQVDANPVAQQRNYKIRNFICGDAKDVLHTCVLTGSRRRSKVDTDYDAAVVDAKQAAINALRTQLDQYALICDHYVQLYHKMVFLFVTSPCQAVRGAVVYSQYKHQTKIFTL
jgi:thiamine pyrophosphate-dependent acetolactate synthase large subunit-like protein